MSNSKSNKEWYHIDWEWNSPEIVGYFLSKNLAGYDRTVTGEDFIRWAEAGKAPNEEAEWLLREALGGLNGSEVRMVYFDGRTHPDNIAKLIVSVGLDKESICWNNWLRPFHPELNIAPRREEWDLHEKRALADPTFDTYTY